MFVVRSINKKVKLLRLLQYFTIPFMPAFHNANKLCVCVCVCVLLGVLLRHLNKCFAFITKFIRDLTCPLTTLDVLKQSFNWNLVLILIKTHPQIKISKPTSDLYMHKIPSDCIKNVMT